MAARSKPSSSETLRYALAPDAASHAALAATFAEYDAMMAILAEIVPASDAGANLVLLHALAYEKVRAATRLPSQMVVLGLRDFAAGRGGAASPGLPLDEKLFAVKGPAHVTLGTVEGRVAVPYTVLGYRQGWRGGPPARLVRDQNQDQDIFTVEIGVSPSHATQEDGSMNQEGILSRMGRLIAGVAHATIEKAEQRNAPAVVEQAIREIDKAADEVRTEIGRAQAERFRIAGRREALQQDLDALDPRIETAVAQAREDLARAAIGRQIDLEAQIEALDKALGGVDERLSEGRKALQAVVAARKDAEQRLKELKVSEGQAGRPDGDTRRERPEDKAARSAARIARLTGVPAGDALSGGEDLDELERLHREQLIADRFRARFGRAD
jgi:hypothetical protein